MPRKVPVTFDEEVAEHVGAKLGERAVLRRPLQASRDVSDAVVDRQCLVRGKVGRQPRHPIPVWGELDRAVLDGRRGPGRN